MGILAQMIPFGMRRLLEAEKVIVLGNQKSGTTALAKLVSLAAGESLTNDIEYFWEEYLVERTQSKRDLNWALRRQREEFQARIIKEPNLSFYFSELLELFPNAKFIWIFRGPVQNIRSICERLDVSAEELMAPISKFDYSLHKRRPYWKWVFENPEFYPHTKTILESLVGRYKVLYEIWSKHSKHCMTVGYESFEANKIPLIKQVLEYCGLEYRYDIKDKIDVAYQPAGARAALPNEIVGYIEAQCAREMNKVSAFLGN
ncbi:MAG: sulfotransferase family protein [Opitutales bacterium]